ncbi:MAG: NrsF family protein [Spirochaetia bacterium]|nr:NrsF family protein [Spirochaetia bacterium]
MKTQELIRNLSLELKPVPRLQAMRSFSVWAFLAPILSACMVILIRLQLPGIYHSGVIFSLETLAVFAAASFCAAASLYVRIPGNKPIYLISTGAALLMLYVISLCIRMFLNPITLTSPTLADIACARDVGLGGLMSAGIMLGMIKRAAPVYPRATALLAGLSAGLLAVALQQFFCPSQAPVHVLLYHLMPTFALAGSGVLMGRLLLHW